MHEADMQAVPELKQLPILDEHDPRARRLTDESSAEVVAEAADTVRLFDLLHRGEYQPIAAVRFLKPESVRVYFRLLDRNDRND